MKKKTLHIINQDDQPIGSVNKSCDECGLAVWNCDHYIEHVSKYTKETADKHNLVRCADK